MDKYIYDDKNGLWYELQGDYYIPCLILPTEKEQPIGLWGQRHLHYLKEYHRLTYTNLLTSGRLNEYLAEIDKQARDCKCRTDLQLSRSGGEENLAAVFMYMTEKSKIYGIILKELFFKTIASKNVLNR